MLGGYDSMLMPLPLFSSIKPWIVFIMSILESISTDFNSVSLGDVANQILSVGQKVSSQGLSVLLFSFSNIYAWLLTLSNFAFNVFLYFTLTIYFLADREDLVEMIFKVIPIDDQSKTKHKNALSKTIQGVFTSTIQLALYQALYTWMIFDLNGINYVYLYTLASAFFKVVPVVSTVMLGVLGFI
jgi:predicted PurR-regulated permease PerM